MADETTVETNSDAQALGGVFAQALVMNSGLHNVSTAVAKQAELGAEIRAALADIAAISELEPTERAMLMSEVRGLEGVSENRVGEALSVVRDIARSARDTDGVSNKSRDRLVEMLHEMHESAQEGRYEAMRRALEHTRYADILDQTQAILEKPLSEQLTQEEREIFFLAMNGETHKTTLMPASLVRGLANSPENIAAIEAMRSADPEAFGEILAGRLMQRNEADERLAELRAAEAAFEQGNGPALTDEQQNELVILSAVEDGVLDIKYADADTLEEGFALQNNSTTSEIEASVREGMPPAMLQRMNELGGPDAVRDSTQAMYIGVRNGDPDAIARYEAAMQQLQRIQRIGEEQGEAAAMAAFLASDADVIGIGYTTGLTSTLSTQIVLEELARDGAISITAEQLTENLRANPDLANVDIRTLQSLAQITLENVAEREGDYLNSSAQERQAIAGDIVKSVSTAAISRAVSALAQSTQRMMISDTPEGEALREAMEDQDTRFQAVISIIRNGEESCHFDKYADLLSGRIDNEQDLIERINNMTRGGRMDVALAALNHNREPADSDAGADMAAVVYGRTVLSLKTFEALAEYANENDGVQSIDGLTASEVINLIADHHPELAELARNPNFREAIETSIRDAQQDESLLDMNRQEFTRRATEIGRNVEDAISAASQALASEQTEGHRGRSAQQRNNRRHDEGVSFIEMEFEDVQAIIQRYASDNERIQGMSAQQLVQYLEETGMIRDNGNADNRQSSKYGIIDRGLAIAAAAGQTNEWTEFGDWNDESLKRLDTDGNGQIDGLEAYDAISIAQWTEYFDIETVQGAPTLLNKIEEAAAGLTGVSSNSALARHDVNQDGQIDEFEAVRAMLANGITDATQVDTTEELRAMLTESQSARELGR